MSSSPETVDMGPKGLLNADGNYQLQHADVYNLLKYVWTGVLLPVTEPKYKARLLLSDDTFGKLQTVITPLVAANVVAQGHCQTFKDVTYPKIVGLANDVHDYAQNAGGKPEDSYYTAIFAAIRSLSTITDDTKKQEQKDIIKGLVDYQVSSINDLVVKAQAAIDALRTFEDQTTKDQSSLKDCSKAIKAKLTAEMGSLDDLDSKLAGYRQDLKDDQAEYEHDKIVACTSLTYCWCFFVGLVVAATVAGVYGNAAARMAERIDAVKDLITSTEGKINEEKHLIADLHSIDDGMDQLLKMIGPAILAIQGMMGSWTAISGDLTGLKDMVDKDVRKANAAIAGIVDTKLVAKWNALGVAVDKYRQIAYITQVEQKTLDDMSKELKAAAQKSSA